MAGPWEDYAPAEPKAGPWQDYAPAVEVPFSEAFGRGLTRAGSFGFLDELAGTIAAGGAGPNENPAATIAALGRGAYRRLTGDPEAERQAAIETARVRAENERLEKGAPGATLGGQLFGALATLPVGFAARAPGLASRMVAGAKTGAVTGALTGAGEAEGGMGERAVGAGIGAGIGGGVGYLGTPVAEGLVKGAGAAAAYPINVARGLLTPQSASERAVGRALVGAERSDPTGINRITQAQFQAQPGEAVVADVLGEPGRKLARSAANISDEAREEMNQGLNERFRSQGSRLGDWLDTQYSFPNVRAQQQALAATARSVNAPAYNRAITDGAGGVWDAELHAISQAPPMQDAVKGAIRQAQTRSAPNVAQGPAALARRWVAPGDKPTLEFWDLVKRQVDQDISVAQRAGRKADVRDLTDLKDTLLAKLDTAVPSYAKARSGAAGFFDADDALMAGQKFATQKFKNDEARAAVQGMSQTEQALFRDGFVDGIKQQLAEHANNRDVLNKIATSDAAVERMRIALGPQRTREFQAVLHAEGIMSRLRQAVQGNSTTAMQLIGAGAAGAGAGGYLGYDPTTSGLSTAIAGGLKKGADARMAQHITRLLMSRDPAVLQNGIRQLARNNRNMELLQALDNAVAKIGAQQGAGIANRQQEGR